MDCVPRPAGLRNANGIFIIVSLATRDRELQPIICRSFLMDISGYRRSIGLCRKGMPGMSCENWNCCATARFPTVEFPSERYARFRGLFIQRFLFFIVSRELDGQFECDKNNIPRSPEGVAEYYSRRTERPRVVARIFPFSRHCASFYKINREETWRKEKAEKPSSRKIWFVYDTRLQTRRVLASSSPRERLPSIRPSEQRLEGILRDCFQPVRSKLDLLPLYPFRENRERSKFPECPRGSSIEKKNVPCPVQTRQRRGELRNLRCIVRRKKETEPL